jgi:hypothetical protein
MRSMPEAVRSIDWLEPTPHTGAIDLKVNILRPRHAEVSKRSRDNHRQRRPLKGPTPQQRQGEPCDSTCCDTEKRFLYAIEARLCIEGEHSAQQKAEAAETRDERNHPGRRIPSEQYLHRCIRGHRNCNAARQEQAANNGVPTAEHGL